MRHGADAGLDEYRRRRSRSPGCVLGPRMRIQAPPNLVRPTSAGAARRRRRRLGRGLAADPGPRQPGAAVAARWTSWPRVTAEAGFDAARAADRAPGVRAGRRARGSTRGCARTSPRWPTRDRAGRPDAAPVGLPWQEPDEAVGPRRAAPTCTPRSTPTGRTADRRSDFDERLRRLGRVRAQAEPARTAARAGRAATPTCAPALRAAERRPGRAAATPTWRSRCCHRRRRRRWTRSAALADDAAPRRRRRRRHLRRQPQHQLHQRLLHRLPVLRVRAAAHATPTRTRCRSTEVADRAEEAWTRGRDRGVHAGRHRPRPAGHRLLRPGRARSRRACPAMHVHAFSARWRSSTARPGPGCRSADWLIEAARGRAGHDPRHRRRDPRRRGPLGADQGQAADGDLDRGRHAPRTSWASGRARR